MRGTITKQGDDTWAVRISAGRDPVTGKRRRIFRTVRGTQEDAERVRTEILHQLDTGIDLDPKQVTTSEYIDRWLRHQRTRIRPKTWKRYESLLRLHVLPHIGAVRLAKVRPVHVQGVLDTMTEGGAAPRSVVQCRAVMHGAFRQAVRWQLLATNPVDAVSAPRPDDPELRTPTAAELADLLRRAKEAHDETAVLLFVATGLRRSELLGLRWPDVDLDRGRARVTRQLQRVPDLDEGGSTIELVELKTPRGRREVALPPFAVEALRAHRKDQTERRLLLGEAWEDWGPGLVFDRGDGLPPDPDAFGARLRRFLQDVGLEGCRLHDLRHGFATALLEQGVHPAIAAAVLGHASPSFTMRTYSHVLDGMQETAADAIEAAVRPPQGEEGGQRLARDPGNEQTT